MHAGVLHQAIMTPLPMFREYCIWLKTVDDDIVPLRTRSMLNIAHARLRVAKRFAGVRIERASPSLVRGYSVGVRLLLSYSAAETMGRAIGPSVKQWTIADESIRLQLQRTGSQLRNWDFVLDEKTRARVDGFVRGEHDNVCVVATALRHLMAHGHFAPAGKLSMTAPATKAVETLCEHLLAATEQRFVRWFQETTDTTRATPRR
jgi:hypothetical protein